ncbi:Beta-1,3-endoglucanase, family GH17 [Zostera marina]|uniref:glucan endo-1,3-beta-D-glucosidase n=1 Tax=Zostera marina TaxID=29655 RepID=A0A0K9Q4L6_ZOSMR|nr:Beta-1,3-endoglucanase, family GH17 [Zostera marina]
MDVGVAKATVTVLICWMCLVVPTRGVGANWGTQTSHPLPPRSVVDMLKQSGFQKVKLFDADGDILNALKKTGFEVMVGIPNDMLSTLADSTIAAQDFVSKNVSAYVNDGVNIRYVAVGNEPFLETSNGSFLKTTFPALQNIQSSVIKVGLSSKVKVTIPLNAAVYESSTSLPSGGDFRSDIHDLMVAIVKFLSDNGSPFTVNIYPFISLYNDHNFPIDFAFFGESASPVVDGNVQYSNVFDANHDTLVWALQKNGYPNLPIIVGEVGWPTDGDVNANPMNAQKFNQGMMNHILEGKGTPLRPGPINAYLFSLIDEDEKSIRPGNFERHWGIYTYDGRPKYQLGLKSPNSGSLVAAKGIQYLDKKWCVMKGSAKLNNEQIPASVSYACDRADCTSLGYQTSCGSLDERGNLSYAFNSYFQKNDQDLIACKFPGLSEITDKDPSTATCKFEIMIDVDSAVCWNVVGWWLLILAFLHYHYYAF